MKERYNPTFYKVLKLRYLVLVEFNLSRETQVAE